MLNHIPLYFTPDLLRLLMAMGHGEELLLSDGNYPSLTTANPAVPRIYLPAEDIGSVLGDILHFLPLDETVTAPLTVMESAGESGALEAYRKILAGRKIKAEIAMLERFAFYKRAAGVAGIVITASTVRGGNILLKKGVVRKSSPVFA